MVASTADRDGLLGAVLEHSPSVVSQRFASEVVLLDVAAGLYFGLNPTAGEMFELLDGTRSVAEAASVFAAKHKADTSLAEEDFLTLCDVLMARHLLRTAASGRG